MRGIWKKDEQYKWIDREINIKITNAKENKREK